LKPPFEPRQRLIGANPIEEDDWQALQTHFLPPQTPFLLHSTSSETKRRRGTFATPWRSVSPSPETRHKTSPASSLYPTGSMLFLARFGLFLLSLSPCIHLEYI